MWWLLLACTTGPVPSTEIATADLFVTMTHEHGDDAYELLVVVTPRVDAEVAPVEDDAPQLVGATAVVRPQPTASGWGWSAQLPDDDGPWTFRWLRPGDDDLVVPLALPLPFATLDATWGEEDLEVRWSPVDEHPLVLTVDTNCGVVRRDLGIDVGAYDLPPAELGAPDCRGTVTLERIQSLDTTGAATVSGATRIERTLP